MQKGKTIDSKYFVLQGQSSPCNKCKTGGRLAGTNLCEICFREVFDLPPTTNKLKQRLVADFINQKLIEYEIDEVYFNIPLGNRLIPDIRFVFNNFNVIIEVDENQHKGYKDEEDRNDMMIDYSRNKCVIIRINVDR